MNPLLFYSTVAAGGIWSGASTAFTVSELVRQIKDADAKLLICTSEFVERTIEAAKQCNIPLDKVLVLDASTPNDWKLLTVGDRKNVLDVVNGKKLEWKKLTTQKECHDVTGCLLYSSGKCHVLPAACFILKRNFRYNWLAQGCPHIALEPDVYQPHLHVRRRWLQSAL